MNTKTPRLIYGKDPADCSAVELQSAFYKLRDSNAEILTAALELRKWALFYLGGQEKTCARSSVDKPMQDACDRIAALSRAKGE